MPPPSSICSKPAFLRKIDEYGDEKPPAEVAAAEGGAPEAAAKGDVKVPEKAE